MQREAEGAGWSGGGRGEPPGPHCLASAQAEATGSAGGAVGQGQVPGWSPAPLARPWGPRGSAGKLPSRQLVRGEGTLISHRPLPAPSCSEGANGPRLQPSREGNLSPPFRRALTRGGGGGRTTLPRRTWAQPRHSTAPHGWGAGRPGSCLAMWGPLGVPLHQPPVPRVSLAPHWGWWHPQPGASWGWQRAWMGSEGANSPSSPPQPVR